MTPDDPRHGTHRGYVVGCRMLCCTVAHMRYMKLYRMGRAPRLTSPVGTVRRIRALQALGWTYGQMGQLVGRGDNWAYMIPRSPSVTTTTAGLIARIYDELSMVIPTGPYASRTRALARRKGWPPPLAWDDIDDPDETPEGWEYQEPRRENQFHRRALDPVVVMRLLQGDKVPSTPDERAAAMERWVADGGSRRELAAWHGWKSDRYSPELRVLNGGAA